jgi:DNA-binding GntR family transcriptional regulator
MFISPQVVHLSRKLGTCDINRTSEALKEHQAILDAICSGNENEAAANMRMHMENTIDKSL